MSAEISFSAYLSANKNSVAVASGSLTKTNDMTGDQMFANVQIVGTSAEALAMNDVATLGLLFVRNMDATNFVQLALDSGMTNKFAKLKPGEFCLVPVDPSATIYAKADTAACNLQVVAVEL